MRIRSRATKVVATLALLGTAATVAGLSTHGDFTDSTAPVNTQVDTGVISIALAPGAYQASVPYVSGGLVPGDSHTLVMDLVNAGNVPLSSLTLRSAVTSSSALDTDTVNGLQLSLESCSQPWTVAGTGYTCAGTVTPFYAGPILLDLELTGAASHAAGARDHLKAVMSLPASADNAMQGKRSTFSFTFTGVQRAGGDR
jgi:hypothetical protein